jgi:hypothetical protein
MWGVVAISTNFIIWIGANKYIRKIIPAVLLTVFYALIYNILAHRYYGYEFFVFLEGTYSMRISFWLMMTYITLLSAGALLCLYCLLAAGAGKLVKYAICFAGGAVALVSVHIFVINTARIQWRPIDPSEYIAAAMRNSAIAAVLSSLVVLFLLEKLMPWVKSRYWGTVVDMEPNEPIPWNHGSGGI